MSRYTTAVDTVSDFKMLQRMLFAACVLIVVASLDASKLHKKSTFAEVTCDPGHAKCPGNSLCIRSSFFCNGYNNCEDWTDEPADCGQRSCEPGEFRCDNGQCLNRTAICMSSQSFDICYDNTDMTNICRGFTCPTGYFKCVSDGKCISDWSLCNGYPQCSDGSDESPHICGRRKCPAGQLKCNIGQCIDVTAYCTRSVSCPDMTRFPDLICRDVECPTGYFKCESDGYCLSAWYLCSGYPQCSDGSDETTQVCDETGRRTCPEGKLKCNNGWCIDQSAYCAAYESCPDNTQFFDLICPDVTCDPGYAKCPIKSVCIPSSLFCNGYDDCGDSTDEPADCRERSCEPGEFRCDNGQCLNRTALCMSLSYDVCYDNTDMTSLCRDVTCPTSYFKCESDGRCIADSQLCSGSSQCRDGSDESPHMCGKRECPVGQLKCNNGQCIDTSAYCTVSDKCRDQTQFPDLICPDVTCDPGYAKCPRKSKCISSSSFCSGYDYCGDSTYEPAYCSERSCEPGEFRCDNGQCLNRTAICASLSFYACQDNTDMKGICLDVVCPTGHFKCESDGKCIHDWNLCSGYSDCSDGSDESLHTCGNRACPVGKLKCNNGQCIDASAYCTVSGIDKCRDKTQFPDLDCPDVTCNPGFVKCPKKSKCIRSSSFCDGYDDCGDSTDEPADCSERSCEPGEFKCDNGQCLNRTVLCTSFFPVGCPDRTDMTGFCRDVTCPTGYFKCESDGKCIADWNVCSGYSECSDGSDESPDICGYSFFERT